MGLRALESPLLDAWMGGRWAAAQRPNIHGGVSAACFEVDLTPHHSHENFEGGLTSLRALSHLQDIPHPWLPGNQVGGGEGKVGEGGHRRASELMQGTPLPHVPGPAPNAGSAWLGLGHLGPKPRARFQEIDNERQHGFLSFFLADASSVVFT